MEVQVGDRVKKGQVLLTDKKNPGINYTSPASGEVIEINRGAKRAFLSLVVKVDGAESIDFLDIVFKLEKAFEISIPRDELFPDDILTNAEYVQDGKVTATGIEQLKKRMPFADLSKFESNPMVQDFGNLLTVSDLCRYVSSKVGAE